MEHPDPTPSAELIERCQRGDRQAFDRLVLQEQQRIYQLAFRIVQRQEGLDDLVQEIFVLLFRKIKTFRAESQFSTWLTRLAIRECCRARRRTRLSRVLFGPDLDVPDEHGHSALRVLELEEEGRELREALDRLPEKQRLVVVLRYFEEMSCEQIAQALECGVGTVRSRLFIARQRLREMLREDEDR